MCVAGIFSWLGSLDSSVINMAIASLALLGVTALIAGSLRRMRQSEDRSALIGMMLQRGMTASDIERVIQAHLGTAEDTDEAGIESPEVRIITLMKENDYTQDDIERVLDAARANGAIDADTLRIIEALVEQGSEGVEIEGILDARRTPPVPHRVAV